MVLFENNYLALLYAEINTIHVDVDIYPMHNEGSMYGRYDR